MEPVPSTYRALCDNVAINALTDRVQTHQAGVGEVEGTLHFSTGRGGCDRIVTDGTGEAIPVLPLNAVFAAGPPDMLVLDVEGFEPAVVKGATRVLADPRLKVVIVETLGLAADYGLDDKAMHETMLGYGFQTCHYDPFRRRLDVTNGMDPVNTVYVRDLATVQERVVAAPGFKADGHVF